MNKAVLFIAAALLAVTPLSAHEGHEAEEALAKAKQSVTAAGNTVKQVATDAKSLAGDAKSAVEGAMDKAEAVAQAQPVEVLKHSLNSHWHNKIVHFPVALGIFGVLFYLISLRWPSTLASARLLMASALALGLAALLTGEVAEEGFRGTSMMETVHAHENAGKAGLILLALMLLLTWFPSLKKWSWIVGILAIASIVMAGAFGGALAAS